MDEGAVTRASRPAFTMGAGRVDVFLGHRPPFILRPTLRTKSLSPFHVALSSFPVGGNRSVLVAASVWCACRVYTGLPPRRVTWGLAPQESPQGRGFPGVGVGFAFHFSPSFT